MGIGKKKMPVSYVGKMIKTAREERNLSINELVDEIRKPQITVKLWQKWEKGKEFPDLDCIYILAEKLDLNPNEMLENRTRIIMESIHEVDWAKRRIGAYAFDIIHITAMQLMLGDQGGYTERLVVQVIDNAVEEFVPNANTQTMFENTVQTTVNNEV